MRREEAGHELVSADAADPVDHQRLREFRRKAAVDLIAHHERTLMRTARRYSICADDAEDAYQRALEILLTKAPPLGGDSLIRWMQTVTKREALGVRRQRIRQVNPAPAGGDTEARDPLELLPFDGPAPDELAARTERVRRSGEALRALKPQEVRALVLKAEGFSYQEIQELTGWTYTKVNRCMAEGRKRFLCVFAEIESGDRCEQWFERLSRIADGEMGGAELDEARLHLDNCGRCRARLRAYRQVPRKVLGLGLPIPVLALLDRFDHLGAEVLERVKGAGVLTGRFLNTVEEKALSLSASGGTRGAGSVALAKVLAVCGMAAAGSAACAVSGVLPEPDRVAAETRSATASEVGSAPSEGSRGVTELESPVGGTAAEESPSGTSPSDQTVRQFSFEARDQPVEAPSPDPEPASSGPSSAGHQFGFEQ